MQLGWSSSYILSTVSPPPLLFSYPCLLLYNKLSSTNVHRLSHFGGTLSLPSPEPFFFLSSLYLGLSIERDRGQLSCCCRPLGLCWPIPSSLTRSFVSSSTLFPSSTLWQLVPLLTCETLYHALLLVVKKIMLSYILVY